MEIVSTTYRMSVKNIKKVIHKGCKEVSLLDRLLALEGVENAFYDSHAGDVVYFTINRGYDDYMLKRCIKRIIKAYENFTYKCWSCKGWN